MKKIIGFLVISGFLMFLPSHFAKADNASSTVPSNVYFFGDGKGYNVDGTQMYYCFGDGSCYSVEGVFAFVREIQNTLTDLQNRVTNLENQPVIQQPLISSAQPTDTVAPIVLLSRITNGWLSSPYIIKNNGALYGEIGLRCDLAQYSPSDSGFAKIEFYLDSNIIGTSTQDGDIVAFETTKYSNGEHLLSAKVYDKAGNVGEDSATISIKN